jgi:hypothetical protein
MLYVFRVPVELRALANPFAQVHEIDVNLAVDLSNRSFPVLVEAGLAGSCIAGFVLWKYDNFFI